MAWTEREVRGQGAAAPRPPEFTYIDLTENYVYYAANHNQGVENIPGISKIALSEVQPAAGKKNTTLLKQNETLLSSFLWLSEDSQVD